MREREPFGVLVHQFARTGLQSTSKYLYPSLVRRTPFFGWSGFSSSQKNFKIKERTDHREWISGPRPTGNKVTTFLRTLLLLVRNWCFSFCPPTIFYMFILRLDLTISESQSISQASQIEPSNEILRLNSASVLSVESNLSGFLSVWNFDLRFISIYLQWKLLDTVSTVKDHPSYPWWKSI